MLILVIGGAASGKSAFAESLACKGASPRVYVATMQSVDAECEKRIARHRQMRAGKGFTTLECPSELENADIWGKTALLECLSNLAANEMFAPGMTAQRAQQKILNGIDLLCRRCERVVVVSNEIFSDGASYDELTQAYRVLLAHLNREIARRADCVFEVIDGIPVVHKGEWQE